MFGYTKKGGTKHHKKHYKKHRKISHGKKRYSKSCKGGMMASTTAQATALGLLGLNLLAASPKRTRNIRRKYRSSRKRR